MRNHLLGACYVCITGIRQKKGLIFMPIKTNRLVRVLSIALGALSCICAFMILPMYILGSAHAQGNLLPSVIAISLCCICIRGLCVYRESLTWQFSYCCLLISSFEIIVFYYNPDKTLESVNAIFWMLEITFLAVLLMIEFNLNVRKILSYPVFIFLLGSLMDVIPGMGNLVKNADVGKEMISLLIIAYPLEILNAFWDTIKKDDKAETEKKLDDLLSKVQNATALASSLKDSQTESRKESRTSMRKSPGQKTISPVYRF